MKRINSIIFFAFIILITGCSEDAMVCSVNPFYLDKNVVYIPEIAGYWSAKPIYPDSINEDYKNPWEDTDTNSVWSITRPTVIVNPEYPSETDTAVIYPYRNYILTLKKPKDSIYYRFHLTLFKIENTLYADFLPNIIPTIEKSTLLRESINNGYHTLARVEMNDSLLILTWLSGYSMAEMIANKRVRTEFMWDAQRERFISIILTSNSKELTFMIQRYFNQKRFIDWTNQPAMIKLVKNKN